MIVSMSPLTDEPLRIYNSIGKVEIFEEGRVYDNAEILVVRLENLHNRLGAFPSLKYIVSPTTGLDHIPLEECKRRGIEVVSLQGARAFLDGIFSTAEHTIGLMFALLRNYKTALTGTKHRDAYRGHTLSNKTIGLIGVGRVGTQVYNLLQTFTKDIPFIDAGESPDKILKYSDIVSLHIPLQYNEGFFTREMFKQMKPTAYLINTSRDAVIERGALKWALENKVIAGAAIDFQDDPELLEFSKGRDDLILTNHIAGNTWEDREKTEIFAANKLKQIYEAKTKRNH